MISKERLKDDIYTQKQKVTVEIPWTDTADSLLVKSQGIFKAREVRRGPKSDKLA